MEKITKYAWNVSEETYRNNDILSYSLIAKYEREGFKCIPTLFDKIQTNSLSLGSAVDAYYTDKENFDKRVLNVNTNLDLQSKSVQIIFNLFKEYSDEYLFELRRLVKEKGDEINEKYLQDFYPNLKKETKLSKLLDTNLIDLFDDLDKGIVEENKILLNNEDWVKLSSIIDCVDKNDKISKILCGENTEDIERFFQLKFIATLNNREYRCMFDELVVVHSQKKIYLYDLKTTYDYAYNFKQNFFKWRYDIQDRLYYTILRERLKGTEYEDYELVDMTNIVVSTSDFNPESNPLLFKFPFCNKRGDLELNGMTLRDPLVIGEELYTILENNMQLPPNIEKDKINEIK